MVQEDTRRQQEETNHHLLPRPADRATDPLHPQIKLWVSGHTHTPPTQPTFDNDINYYHGKILDVYNPTWDGKTIWTNSLYLYKDKIVIKTYDMDKHETLDNLTRTVQIDR